MAAGSGSRRRLHLTRSGRRWTSPGELSPWLPAATALSAAVTRAPCRGDTRGGVTEGEMLVLASRPDQEAPGVLEDQTCGPGSCAGLVTASSQLLSLRGCHSPRGRGACAEAAGFPEGTCQVAAEQHWRPQCPAQVCLHLPQVSRRRPGSATSAPGRSGCGLQGWELVGGPQPPHPATWTRSPWPGPASASPSPASVSSFVTWGE